MTSTTFTLAFRKDLYSRPKCWRALLRKRYILDWTENVDCRVLRAFSLLLWSGKSRDVQLFLLKSCEEISCSLYTESENAINAEIKAELVALPLDIRARFERIVDLIQSYGLERMREPYVKHLEGALWEMRMSGRSGIARAVYVTAIGKRVVVVHVFVKKTQATPRREIETALKRAKLVL